MDFLRKIQNLPEGKRKIILWTAVIIVCFILLTFWVKISQQRIKSFEAQEFRQELNLPSFSEELKNLLNINEKNQ
jgi:uncharacterized membrane protein YvbJ